MVNLSETTKKVSAEEKKSTTKKTDVKTTARQRFPIFAPHKVHSQKNLGDLSYRYRMELLKRRNKRG